MAKFPTRANELRRSIHAIKAEMDSVRFSRGAAWEAGFNADLDAGLARSRAGGAGGMVGGAGGPSGGFLRINQGVGVASKALSAMRSGSILPLVAALGSTGLAGAAIAAGVAVSALAGKAIMAADKVRQSREEFFKQVDALGKAGADVSFAKDLERVRSLSTAWTEAKTRYEDYLAKIGERSGGLGMAVGLLDSGAAEGAFAPQLGHDLANLMPGQHGPAGITGLDRANLAAAAARQKDAFAAYHERIRLAKEASDAEIAFNEKFNKAREAADLRAYQARIEHIDAELKKRLSGLNEQLEKAASLRERHRTPGERMRSELDEIMGNPHIDRMTRMRALEDLRARAEGMIPDAGGRAHARSIGGIRAGSVEALRAQFAGGTAKSERELKAAEKTAKETEAAKGLLTEIRDALKDIRLGEAP